MLIYEGTKDNFLSSVEQDTIAVEIENNIYERMHRHTAKNEFRAWENSMEYMYKVLNDQDILSDADSICATVGLRGVQRVNYCQNLRIGTAI